MSKRDELDAFIKSANELINGKYILADVKIVGLLKSIAVSETLIALFKNCLDGFDYAAAKKKYFVKSSYLSGDRGEFVLPQSSRELLAFIFNVLMDIDAKRMMLSDLLDRFFYGDGSTYSQYSLFINSMIIPFRDSVKILMEGIIGGTVQDPVEALTEAEEIRAEKKEKQELEEKKEKELSKKAYGKAIKDAKFLLIADKKKIKESKLKEFEKEDLTLVVDMMANVLDSLDKDAIDYAFIAYRYAAKAHPILFFGKSKKLESYLKDVKNGL